MARVIKEADKERFEAEMMAELERRLAAATLPSMSSIEKMMVLRDVVTAYINEQIKAEAQ